MIKHGKVIGFLGVIVYVLYGSLLLAQVPDTLWTKTYGGASTDVGQSVQQTSDDGYIITGRTRSFGAGLEDVFLIRTDANGDALWTRTYGGTGTDVGQSVQQTTDNGYVIAGITYSFGAGDYDVYLIKTDVNGDTLWTKAYGGTGEDRGHSVQQTTDNGYIIAGQTRSFGAGSYDVYLIKTDANGDALWTKTYGGPDGDYGYCVQQTTDNGYIITGRTNSFGAGGADVYLIKTDANGDTLWTRTYGGTNWDYGQSVQQTTDNGYIVAGNTNSFGVGSYDIYLIKTDANGDTLWTRTYGGLSYDYGCSVQQTTDDGYVIAGYTLSFGAGDFDVYLIKTDVNGDTLWTKTIGGQKQDQGWSVQQTANDGYIVAGQTLSFGAGEVDVYLVNIEGTLPAFSVTPGSVDFGNVVVDSSKTDSVTVTNTGSAPLNVTSVESDNTEFMVTPTTGSLAPDASMQFYITFTPTDPGAKAGNIIFTHNATTSPDTVTVVGNGVVGIKETRVGVPTVYALSQNYPNPFKTETGIYYQLPQPGVVTIAIYNVAGQCIKTLVDERMDAGYYTVRWDGRGQDGQNVSNGVYFCRMITGEYTAVKKILLMW